MGFNCSDSVGCQYWDNDILPHGDWNTAGCVAAGVQELNGCTPGGEASSGESGSGSGVPCDYVLKCNCTHLTDFAGVAIPTSVDELLAQLEPTITLPCPDGFFAPFKFMENPFLYSLIKGLTLINLICIAVFRWRYKMRMSGRQMPWEKGCQQAKAKLMDVIEQVKHRGFRSVRVAPAARSNHGDGPAATTTTTTTTTTAW